MMTASTAGGGSSGGAAWSTVTRVLIVDDHALVRDGLKGLLEREPDLRVCGEAADEAEAKRLVAHLKPDIISLDLMLNGSIALRLLEWLRKEFPDVIVLVTSMYDESLYGRRVLAAGAHGYVSKNDPTAKLIQAIRTVRDHGYFFSDGLVHHVMRSASSKSHDSGLRSLTDLLTPREVEVFSLLGEGTKTSEIAARLGLSVSTVETYRERLKRKLGVDNAAQLVRAAVCWVRDGDLPSTGDPEP